MTALRTLLTGMSANQIRKVSTTGGGGLTTAALARAIANFNNGGTGTDPWSTNGQVATAAPSGSGSAGGIDAGSTIGNQTAFCSAGIHPDDGHLIFTGGGHSNSGDGSIFKFDIQAAANSINNSGPGGTWTLALKGPAYLDAHIDARPSAATSPIGNSMTITAPTVNQNAFWLMKNVDGKVAPMSQHTYHLLKGVPGTSANRWMLSGFAGYSQDASATPNIFCFWDENNANGITTALGSTTGADSESNKFGYAQCRSSDASPGGFSYNPFTTGSPNAGAGEVWSPTIGSGFGGNNLVKIASPFSNPVFNGWGATTPNIVQNSASNDCVVIKDPAGTSNQAVFMHGCDGAGNVNEADFILWSGLNQASGNITCTAQAYGTNGGPTAGQVHHTYDTTRNGSLGMVWLVDANGVIWQVSPNTTISSWVLTKITYASGSDTPANNNSGNGAMFALQYIASQDCLIISCAADVWVFRPSGWNPPAEASSCPPTRMLTGIGCLTLPPRLLFPLTGLAQFIRRRERLRRERCRRLTIR